MFSYHVNNNFGVFNRISPTNLHVRLGEFDIIGRLAANSSNITSAPSADAANNLFRVEKILIHERYEARSHVNDM